MPLVTAVDLAHGEAARRSERDVLGAVAGVVATSDWTRRQLIAQFSIPPDRVHVARPGVDRVHPARPGVDRDRAPLDAPGDRLLCVGAVAPHKGQDLLVEALGGLSGLDWQCMIVGPLDRDPRFVGLLRDRIGRLGIGDRVQFTGMLTGRTLDRAYADADVLVVPSRSETYGMVVTEALAHGIPVIGADVGGLPEALGYTADGQRPGRLVAPDDSVALGAAVAEWLRDGAHRRRLRAAALRRGSTLAGWDQTVRDLQIALAGAQVQARASLP
jgi:glycosyltransferase involved in cell wall biosynthesis